VNRAVIGLSCLVALAGSGTAQTDPFVVARDAKASVLIFTTIDCPISNRYAPEIIRLRDEFTPQGVRFTLVFANPADDTAAIVDHMKRFGYAMPYVRDANHVLVKRAGVTIAPEAAVIDGTGRVVYRGRIDDRYIALVSIVRRQRSATFATHSTPSPRGSR
jgi:hypothetical protein